MDEKKQRDAKKEELLDRKIAEIRRKNQLMLEKKKIVDAELAESAIAPSSSSSSSSPKDSSTNQRHRTRETCNAREESREWDRGKSDDWNEVSNKFRPDRDQKNADGKGKGNRTRGGGHQSFISASPSIGGEEAIETRSAQSQFQSHRRIHTDTERGLVVSIDRKRKASPKDRVEEKEPHGSFKDRLGTREGSSSIVPSDLKSITVQLNLLNMDDHTVKHTTESTGEETDPQWEDVDEEEEETVDQDEEEETVDQEEEDGRPSLARPAKSTFNKKGTRPPPRTRR